MSIDTSAEAVEKLVEFLHYKNAPVCAATLRALAAENARLREALNRIMECDRVATKTGDPELGAIYSLGRCGQIASSALKEPRHD